MEHAELSERANQARNLAMGLLATAVEDLIPPAMAKPEWTPVDGRDRRRWQSEWNTYHEERLYHEQARLFLFAGDPIITKSGRRITSDDLLAELDLDPAAFRRLAQDDPKRLGKAMFDAVHGAELRVFREDRDADEQEARDVRVLRPPNQIHNHRKSRPA